MVKIVKQLSILLTNRPGLLSHACSVLSDNKVNILALSVIDHVDHSVVRFVADNPTKALLLLEDEDIFVIETDVICCEIGNMPGTLTNIANKLARADINIDYAYCTATDKQDSAFMILKTDQLERTVDILMQK